MEKKYRLTLLLQLIVGWACVVIFGVLLIFGRSIVPVPLYIPALVVFVILWILGETGLLIDVVKFTMTKKQGPTDPTPNPRFWKEIETKKKTPSG